jgi:hypothetical protein
MSGLDSIRKRPLRVLANLKLTPTIFILIPPPKKMDK